MSHYSTPPGHAPEPAFIGPSGTVYDAGALGCAIRERHPALIVEHIGVQLEALGLSDEIARGTTPYPLPFSFAE